MVQSAEELVPVELEGQALRVDAAAREVLGKTYMTLRIDHFHLNEDFTLGKAVVGAELLQFMDEGNKSMAIKGEGVGLVDAFFEGMMRAFAPEYASLSRVAIVDFNIHIKLRDTYGRKTDAFAIAVLRVKNSEGYEYVFSSRTPSISQSSAGAVLEVVKFFVNSERAYVQAFLALEDAKKRARSDLVERYRNQLATLVTATSYKEIATRLMGKGT